MDPNDNLFGEYEFTEIAADKLTKITKQAKKAIKELNYNALKPQLRQKFKKEKKQRIQLALTTLDKAAKHDYLDQMRQKRLDKKERGLQALNGRLRIVVDCAFELLMEDRETRSLARQIAELYACNRSQTTHQPARIFITTLYPKLKHHMEALGAANWQVECCEEDFMLVKELQNAQVVYLTPDAQEELDTVDENCIYVVGGLVDRKIVKNATLNRANLLQVAARRLPIGNFIKANFKKALNVSTAALMIPEYLSVQDWEKTFNNIVPQKFSKKLDDGKIEKQLEKQNDKQLEKEEKSERKKSEQVNSEQEKGKSEQESKQKIKQSEQSSEQQSEDSQPKSTTHQQ